MKLSHERSMLEQSLLSEKINHENLLQEVEVKANQRLQ
jgi:hypothetical protein